MSTELRIHNYAREHYVRALSQTWRNTIQLFDPSIWLVHDLEAEEKMLRDHDIRRVIGIRRHMIAGRQWTLVPRTHAPDLIWDEARDPRLDLSKLAVQVGTELLGGIKHFTTARLNLSRAFFSGQRFGRIHGKTRTLRIGDGISRTWWVPTRIADLDKRRYRKVPVHKDGELSAHWERWDVAKSAWEPETQMDAIQTINHVYEDDEASLGYGRALREALGWIWYTKTHVMEETIQAVERYAQGTLIAKVDMLRDAATGLANPELIREHLETLEDMRARHVLVMDRADEIEILQGNAEGWQLLDRVEEKLKNAIVGLVLGSNLPTEATEGGSYALGEVQEDTTEMLIQFDRETLEETLTDDLIGCVWFKNHANLYELGISQEKPRFNITQEKKLDPKERADVAAVVSGMGVELSLDEVLEQTGFRRPEEGEEVVKAQPAQPAFPPGMGFKGGE